MDRTDSLQSGTRCTPAAIHSTVSLLLCAVLGGALGIGCASRPKNEDPPPEIGCMASVIKADERLALARNAAPREMPIGDAVRAYLEAFESLDMSECPPPFREAIRRHLGAWRETLPWLDAYPELRGELHEVFDVIGRDERNAEFRAAVGQIIQTWSQVEQAMVDEGLFPA